MLKGSRPCFIYGGHVTEVKVMIQRSILCFMRDCCAINAMFHNSMSYSRDQCDVPRIKVMFTGQGHVQKLWLYPRGQGQRSCSMST